MRDDDKEKQQEELFSRLLLMRVDLGVLDCVFHDYD